VGNIDSACGVRNFGRDIVLVVDFAGAQSSSISSVALALPPFFDAVIVMLHHSTFFIPSTFLASASDQYTFLHV